MTIADYISFQAKTDNSFGNRRNSGHETIRAFFACKFRGNRKSLHVGKRTMTGAIDYVMNNKEGLMRFIEYGDAPMSNQTAEQSIRPFVVIRNRCRFHFSMAGADVSAMLYSLMITARENGCHPYGYFEYLLEKLPGMDPKDEEGLRKLLPYSDGLPYRTKIFTRKEIKDILEDKTVL